MSELRLYLDENLSYTPVIEALLQRGHDVTRTPCEWMPAGASDESQLLGATAHGRAILTYNVGDFVRLARRFPGHHGIILAKSGDWNVSTLVRALDRVLKETDAADWEGQVRWLNQWRD